MIGSHYYKVTVRFRSRPMRSKIVEHYTDDKSIVEERLIYALKRKYGDEFHSMDIWEVPKSDPEVQKYIKQKPLN